MKGHKGVLMDAANYGPTKWLVALCGLLIVCLAINTIGSYITFADLVGRGDGSGRRGNNNGDEGGSTNDGLDPGSLETSVSRFGATKVGWLNQNRDHNNSRWVYTETFISVETAKDMTVVWQQDVGGDTSNTPTISHDGVLYTCNWNGSLYAFNTLNHKKRWSVSLTDPFNNNKKSFCRTSPAIWEDLVVVGLQTSGTLLAFDRHTGAFVWNNTIETHPAAVITGAPSVHEGVLYGGVSSLDELRSALINNYTCCTFRGSVYAMDIRNGQLIWKRHTMHQNSSGVAVWGAIAINAGEGVIVLSTGNTYKYASDIEKCINDSADANISNAHCRGKGDYSESIVALRMTDGEVIKTFYAGDLDAWTVSCFPGFGNPHNCPPNFGADADFGCGPMLSTKFDKDLEKLVLSITVGQKSGVLWDVDNKGFKLLAGKSVGPGSETGGIQWGTAFDDRHYYVAISNANMMNYSVPEGMISNGKKAKKDELHCGGFWAAVRKTDFEIVWMTPDPYAPSGSQCALPYEVRVTTNARDMGPVTVVNKGPKAVVFGPSMSGHMYALAGGDGKVLWDYNAGSSLIGGVSGVGDGVVYFGTGYTNFGLGSAGSKLVAVGFPPKLA